MIHTYRPFQLGLDTGALHQTGDTVRTYGMRQCSRMRIRRILSGALVGWILMALPLRAQTNLAQSHQGQISQPAPSTPAVSSSDEFCTARNSLQQDEQVILGQVPDAPYVVVVPGYAEEKLTAVRQCVPDAFQADSRLGAYIRAGAFSDRRSASRLSRHLRRSFNLDARVMYLP